MLGGRGFGSYQQNGKDPNGSTVRRSYWNGCGLSKDVGDLSPTRFAFAVLHWGSQQDMYTCMTIGCA